MVLRVALFGAATALDYSTANALKHIEGNTPLASEKQSVIRAYVVCNNYRS